MLIYLHHLISFIPRSILLNDHTKYTMLFIMVTVLQCYSFRINSTVLNSRTGKGPPPPSSPWITFHVFQLFAKQRRYDLRQACTWVRALNLLFLIHFTFWLFLEIDCCRPQFWRAWFGIYISIVMCFSPCPTSSFFCCIHLTW